MAGAAGSHEAWTGGHARHERYGRAQALGMPARRRGDEAQAGAQPQRRLAARSGWRARERVRRTVSLMVPLLRGAVDELAGYLG